ncbi:MAG: DUF6159 family protein [archaeon]
MGIGDTFTRSWDLTKQTFSVIKADKEILIFPILASFFSIIFFAVMAVPFLMSNIMVELGFDKLGDLAYLIVMFLLYLGIAFISTFFNVAVVYCAKKRFEGGDPTFSEGLKEAFKRIHLIFMWSIVSAIVGIILNSIENAARKSNNALAKMLLSGARSILGLLWSIVSVFVVPAMVFDNVGPFEALKKSTIAVKKTWGESIIRHYGLGLVQVLFIIAGIIIFGVPGFLLLTVMWQAGVAVLALGVLYIIIIMLVFGTANTVFNTALYMYAEKGKVPSVYKHETMQNAFIKQ